MMIETERLIVRLFREEDADALYRIKTDPQVMEYCLDFLNVEAKQQSGQKRQGILQTRQSARLHWVLLRKEFTKI